MFLRDSVVVINIVKGDTLRTSELWWDQKTEKFYTDKPVRIYQPDKTIFGTGLEAAQDFKSYDIFKITGTVLHRRETNWIVSKIRQPLYGAVKKTLYNLNNLAWPSIGTNFKVFHGFSGHWVLIFRFNDSGTWFDLDFGLVFSDLDFLVLTRNWIWFVSSIINREYKHT